MDSSSSEFSYGFTRLVLGDSTFLPMSEEDYHQLLADKAVLLAVLDVEEAFDVLIENFLEFEKACLSVAADHMIHTSLEYVYYQGVRRNLARKLSNVLTSARFYIDLIPRLHNELHGDDSAEPDIKADLSSEYDRRLGYRVMEAIRNHAQHRGLPAHGVSVGGQWKDDELVFTLTLRINTAELARDGHFKRTVLDELNALGRKVDVRPFVMDYLAGLMTVHEKFRSHHEAKVRASEQRLTNAIKNCDAQGMTSNVGLAIVKRDARGVAVVKEQLFDEIVEYRHELVGLNAHFANFQKRHVSGR